VVAPTGEEALAFHHAAVGGHWDVMDGLWNEKMLAIVTHDPGMVRSSLAGLPASVTATRPSMRVFASALEMVVTETGGDAILAARRSFASECARSTRLHWSTLPLSELLVVGTGSVIYLRLRGCLRESAEFAHRLDVRINALSRTQRAPADQLAWFHLERGITSTLMDDQVGAVDSYERSWEHGMGSTFDLVPSHAAANLALTHSLAGEQRQAELWLERHHRRATGHGTWSEVAAVGGDVARRLLDLDRLVDVGPPVAEAVPGSPSSELWPFVAYLEAQTSLQGGDTVEGLARLVETVGLHAGPASASGVSDALVSRGRADLLLAGGRGEEAASTLRARGDPSPLGRVPAARIRLLGGKQGALEDRDPMILDPAVSTRDRMELLLLGATAALRGADLRTAKNMVDQAMALYAETKVVRPFSSGDPAEMASLLALADVGLDPVDEAKLVGLASVYPRHLVLVALSEREQCVLSALAGMGTRQAMADSLYVSVNTIKTQLASIYRKLDSTTRAEALAKARDYGILPSAA
jgi:LuxR family maltose regulon positive regulatory protein